MTNIYLQKCYCICLHCNPLFIGLFLVDVLNKYKNKFYKDDPRNVAKWLILLAERLRSRSREQKVPSSSPRLGISVEVTS